MHNPALFKRILQEGSLGFGESYMDGWWECERLDMLFTRILQAGVDERLPKSLSDIARVAYARLFNRQSRKRARQVGKEHYDIGNDLFRAMLDPYMQYSCGYWKEAQTLEQAQQAKLRMICEKLQLKPGMTLLDIGCGWGGLAQFAAQNYGVSVHGVTISAEQQKLAQARCAGLDVGSCCRTTAIWIASSIASCRSACSSTSGQKLRDLFQRRGAQPEARRLVPAAHHRFQSDRSQRRRTDRQIHLPQRLPAFGAAYRRGQRRAFRDGGLAQLWRRLRSHADGGWRTSNGRGRNWPAAIPSASNACSLIT